MFARFIIAFAAAFTIASPALAQFSLPKEIPLNPHTRIEDVIYSRKDGVARTMDVFIPKNNSNGAGIIMCISAEYKSGKEMLNRMLPFTTGNFLNRGYVVFMVTHGSQPKYSVPEIVGDMHQAVHFIRENAKEYKVNPERLGIVGASSGGQLSLMVGCAGEVAAVACIFPVTDFLEYDKPNLTKEQEPFRVLFDILETNPKTNRRELISPMRRTQIGKECSPLFCARKGAAACLIIHGDADTLVPVRQSREMSAKLKECGARCQYVEVHGMKHDPFEAVVRLPVLADWLDKELVDKYLKK